MIEIPSLERFIELLYTHLSLSLKDKYEILSISLEPGVIDGKSKVIIYIVPTKKTCINSLFDSTSSIKEPVWKNTSVDLLEATTLHTILSRLLLNLYSYVNVSDLYLQNPPPEIESVHCRSILTFNPYGISGTAFDLSYIYLLFNNNTRFYSDLFKTFIEKNKFNLLPKKEVLVLYLGIEVKKLLDRVNSSDFNRNRFSFYNDIYSLFTLFLIIQQYIISGLLSTQFNSRQSELLKAVKLSASPLGYINNAINVLITEQNMIIENKQTSEEYKTQYKNILSEYLIQYMEIPSISVSS